MGKPFMLGVGCWGVGFAIAFGKCSWRAEMWELLVADSPGAVTAVRMATVSVPPGPSRHRQPGAAVQRSEVQHCIPRGALLLHELPHRRGHLGRILPASVDWRSFAEFCLLVFLGRGARLGHPMVHCPSRHASQSRSLSLLARACSQVHHADRALSHFCHPNPTLARLETTRSHLVTSLTLKQRVVEAATTFFTSHAKMQRCSLSQV